MAKEKEKTKQKETKPKKLSGKVVSNKMEKTVVVRVDRLVEHPVYKKRRMISKRYKAHDESGKLQEGDKVVIEESRPLSKTKKWVVVDNKNKSDK